VKLSQPRSLGLLALLFSALWALTGCPRKSLVFSKAPIIVISIDTLRADHLPLYGYRSVETPAIDALARDSLVFDNAIAQVPLTLPSHTCLFTGLLPFQSGVRDNVGYRLGKEHPTLASFLKTQGYATGGAVSAVVLARNTGIAEGFDFYEDSIESRDASEALGRVQRSGENTEKLLEAWIEKAGSQSLFAFLHLYEPHAPYEPPEPYATRYAGRPYDGEIATADAVVARFVSFLKQRGLYDRAILVLLSDHGEGLGDHGEDEHGVLLYREEVRVPLLLKLPASRDAGRRIATPVGIIDIFPTVAALLGQPPPKEIAGRFLLASSGKGEAVRHIYSETLYPRYHFGWSDLASLTDDRYQYIHAPRAELYDWLSDPAERKDLASGLPAPFRGLRAQLLAMDRPLQSPGASDPETIKKLASLGYIGAAAPAGDRKDLPDPKDHIGTIERLKESSRLVAEHKNDEAVRLLESLTRENPLMLDVWETLARTLRRAGRTKEALVALEKADRLTPGTPAILMGLADIHRELGQYDRARQLTLAARTAGASEVDQMLASIALAQGDLATARTEVDAALAAKPGARTPLLLSAQVAFRSGDLANALSLCDRAIEAGRARGEGPLINLQSTRGDILARMGREREAQEAFLAEIREFPDNLDAWSRLALLYASSGQEEPFRALLQELARKVPTRPGFETAARICEIVGDRAGAREWHRRAAGTK